MSARLRVPALPFACFALALTACAHNGKGSLSGGGTTPPPPPPAFTLDDLMGDWVGQLVPNSPARLTQNFYLRFNSDLLTEAAESGGNEWRLDNSDREFEFSGDGVLTANLGLLAGVAGLEIAAEMDEALTVLSGTYVQVGSDLFPVTGTIELVRSTGVDMYDEAMLAGAWSGEAMNPAGRTQILELEFDADGVVLSGKMIRTSNGSVRRNYVGGAGAFTFFDGAVGRMENVTLTATNNDSTTFHFLLMDRDGAFFAGPGTDQKLVSGVLRMFKQQP